MLQYLKYFGYPFFVAQKKKILQNLNQLKNKY